MMERVLFRVRAQGNIVLELSGRKTSVELIKSKLFVSDGGHNILDQKRHQVVI
jgi:hypothetical protein